MDEQPDRPQEPDYRFTLANERTFLAWLRTALALLAAGVAVVQLVPEFGVTGARDVVGIALAVLAVVVAAAAMSRWRRVQRAMECDDDLPPTRLPLLLGTALMLIAVAVAVLLALSGDAMTRAARRERSGLQVERTLLAWDRTALALLANGALLLLRALRGIGTVVVVPTALALGVALVVAVLGRLRARRLRRDRTGTGGRELMVAGGGAVALGTAVLVVLVLGVVRGG